MKLYLVQHAKAKSKDEDPERPLSQEGWRDINNVVAYVAKQPPVEIHQIFHSGKTRARQTAEVLADALRPPAGVEAAADLKALDDPSIWAGRLAEIGKDIILVGHRPYMPKLAGLLVCQDEDKEIIDFQMGGIVCLSQNSEQNWLVQWIVTPEIVNANQGG